MMMKEREKETRATTFRAGTWTGQGPKRGGQQRVNNTQFTRDRHPFTMSTYGTTRHHPAAPGFSNNDRATDYHTTLFRRLTWDGTVPLEIRVDPKELPANSDRGLECYFMQAPRVSYLPLLMPEIRRFFLDLVFDEAAAKELKDDDWWLETAEGVLLKWWASLQHPDNVY